MGAARNSLNRARVSKKDEVRTLTLAVRTAEILMRGKWRGTIDPSIHIPTSLPRTTTGFGCSHGLFGAAPGGATNMKNISTGAESGRSVGRDCRCRTESIY